MEAICNENERENNIKWRFATKKHLQKKIVKRHRMGRQTLFFLTEEISDTASRRYFFLIGFFFTFMANPTDVVDLRRNRLGRNYHHCSGISLAYGWCNWGYSLTRKQLQTGTKALPLVSILTSLGHHCRSQVVIVAAVWSIEIHTRRWKRDGMKLGWENVVMNEGCKLLSCKRIVFFMRLIMFFALFSFIHSIFCSTVFNSRVLLVFCSYSIQPNRRSCSNSSGFPCYFCFSFKTIFQHQSPSGTWVKMMSLRQWV